MKKSNVLALPIVTLFGLVAMNGQTSIMGVKADGAISESMSATDMVIFTAQQNGGAYSGYKLVNTQVLHGYVGGGSINAFTTYTYDGNAWAGTLGAEGDDCYINPHWKVFTLNNDGAIFKVTAKENISVDITKTVTGGDWVDAVTLSVYRETVDGTVSSVYLKELKSDTTAAEYSGTYSLNKGETLYYELRFQWTGDHRNIINLPTFTFTQIEGGEEGGNTPAPEPADLSQETTVTMKQLVKELAIGEGKDVSLKEAEANIYQGKPNGTYDKFNSYTYDAEKESCLLSNAGVWEGEDMAAVTDWRIKTTSSSWVVFSFTAKTDLKLTISHPALTADNSWIDQYGQFFSLSLKNNDQVFEQWNREISSLPRDADEYGGSIHLKAGDTALWTFGSTIADQRLLEIYPTFVTDSSSFDVNEYEKEMVIASDSLYLWDGVTEEINHNYGVIDSQLMSYQYLVGTPTMSYPCTYHEGDGEGKENDSIWDSATKKAGFQRWQIQCDQGLDAMIKMTVKADVSITITHTAIWQSAWSSTNSAIRYYAIDEEGTMALLKTIVIYDNSPENAYGITVSLKAGQTLLMDYYTLDGEWYSVNFAPHYELDSTAFEENDVPDFEAVKILNQYAAEKKEALDDHIVELGEENYSLDNYQQILNIVDEAKTAIDEASSKEEIDEIYRNAIAKMDDVKTLKEETEELIAYREKTIAAVNEIYQSLNQNEYTSEDWEKITKAKEDAIDAINKATTKSACNSALSTFKAVVNRTEKKAPSTGCRGELVVSVATMAVALLGAGLIAIARKHKEDR